MLPTDAAILILMATAPPPSSDLVARRMRNTPRRDTPAEMSLRHILHARGLRYRVDYPPIPGFRRRADIVFTYARVAVFVDGCFWHHCAEHGTFPKANAEWWWAKLERTVARDRETDACLDSRGWAVVRVWEHDDETVAADRVIVLVSERRRERKALT